ncbi:MAG: hypothetical protein FWG52_08025 [Proteobacteria bacterium]|nr:hypothetical protein [Pseudomonadota bacterium]
MSRLQAVHGRIIELRRHVNVHLSHRRPFAPSERYELWIRVKGGGERQYIIHSRTMPARRGHEVSLIVTGREAAEVLGLVNVSAPCDANYIRTDPPSLLRGRDALVVLALSVALMVKWGGIGAVLCVPAGVIYLIGATIVRAIVRCRRAALVDQAIKQETRRINEVVKQVV